VFDGVVNRYWNYGDGSSAQYFPDRTHVYGKDGMFTAVLGIIDGDGTHETGSTLITVLDSTPDPDFTADVLEGDAPLTVLYTDVTPLTPDVPFAYEWNFGDGSPVATEKSPVHVYSSPGNFTVTLTVTDNDGSQNSIIKTDYIKACFPPVTIAGNAAHYSSIQSAYDAVLDNDRVEIRAASFAENLNVNRPISFFLTGGYDCLHTESSGITTIEGDITVTDGTVIDIRNIQVESP
jgi:PKD repeat protein